ncbi:MAG: hypothetical protein ACE5OZ_12755 [Candidatus Heimdallarchaeota archaeon]
MNEERQIGEQKTQKTKVEWVIAVLALFLGALVWLIMLPFRAIGFLLREGFFKSGVTPDERRRRRR